MHTNQWLEVIWKLNRIVSDNFSAPANTFSVFKFQWTSSRKSQWLFYCLCWVLRCLGFLWKASCKKNMQRKIFKPRFVQVWFFLLDVGRVLGVKVVLACGFTLIHTWEKLIRSDLHFKTRIAGKGRPWKVWRYDSESLLEEGTGEGLCIWEVLANQDKKSSTYVTYIPSE